MATNAEARVALTRAGRIPPSTAETATNTSRIKPGSRS